MLGLFFKFIISVFFLQYSFASLDSNVVLYGIDNLYKMGFNSLKDKNIALLYNEQSKTYNNKDILDLMLSHNLNVKLLMFPEHGPSAVLDAGERFNHGVYKNLDYISLYSSKINPNKDDLENIDIIVYDLQDVGSKYYTYISTMTYVMEVASENNIEFMILDRPNPINGVIVEGPINLVSSFVGMHEIPIRHGMTSGELARMIVNENWCDCDNLKLTIIPVLGWDREKYFDDYNNLWHSPSPNIKNIDAALAYSGMCLLEGTNLSEGRGTDAPFLKFGAPWITDELYMKLKKYSFPGIEIIPIEFIPSTSKFKGVKCIGMEIVVKDRDSFNSLIFSITLLKEIHDLYPDFFVINDFLYTLYGSMSLECLFVNSGCELSVIFRAWELGIKDFKRKRFNYLIY